MLVKRLKVWTFIYCRFRGYQSDSGLQYEVAYWPALAIGSAAHLTIHPRCVCAVQSGVQLAAFDVICAQMLQDVQERLVFRTHIYIRQEILNYNPASGDLAYPSKLEMMEVSISVSVNLIF